MFGASRKTLEALQSIRGAISGLGATSVRAQVDPERLKALTDRLEALELSRAKWEAEIEAQLLKADSKYKAAAAAESRARTMEKFDSRIADEGIVDIPQGVEPEELPADSFPPEYVPSGEGEGMLGVPVGVETTPKARALRAKFS